MRTLIGIVAAAFLASSAISCNGAKQSVTAGQASQPAAGPKAPAGENAVIIASAGKPVLRLTLEPGAKAFPPDATGTKTVLVDAKQQKRAYLWTVAGASTLDKAVPMVPEVIKDEFVGFKTATTKDITVAGAAGHYLTGTGKEADDGDPGKADVVIFAIAGQVFIACVHGEELSDAARGFLMKTLQTARVP